jgi:hypothetical protein
MPDDGLENPAQSMEMALERVLGGTGLAGKRIAIAVGSRGIARLADIVRTTAVWLRKQGALPFVVPAMGSHGGATAAGQEAVLASYGVTERGVGAPIVSSMETVQIGEAGDEIGVPVFMDRHAYESDGVIAINRVKPHTDFHGFPESGVLKLLVIGLGKHDQARAVHGYGVRGLRELILPAARVVLGTGRILAGVGIVENAADEPCRIEAANADGIEAMERELLEDARARMPRLVAGDLDLLIVDEIGKDKSGTCLDTNVIGRIRIEGQDEPASPRIRCILARRLTEASHGNAIGVGLTDVITRELYEAIDFDAMYENGITSSFSERVKIPLVAADDPAGLRAALRFAALGPDPDRAAETARIMQIPSTLELASALVSEPLVDELRDRRDVEIGGPPQLLLQDGRFSDCPL